MGDRLVPITGPNASVDIRRQQAGHSSPSAPFHPSLGHPRYAGYLARLYPRVVSYLGRVCWATPPLDHTRSACRVKRATRSSIRRLANHARHISAADHNSPNGQTCVDHCARVAHAGQSLFSRFTGLPVITDPRGHPQRPTDSAPSDSGGGISVRPISRVMTGSCTAKAGANTVSPMTQERILIGQRGCPFRLTSHPCSPTDRPEWRLRSIGSTDYPTRRCARPIYLFAGYRAQRVRPYRQWVDTSTRPSRCLQSVMSDPCSSMTSSPRRV